MHSYNSSKFVMKNQAGIDLSHLSQAQRKMCVRLLAVNNVQFKEDKDSYIATLTVPNSDLNNYLKAAKQNQADKKQSKLKATHKEKTVKPGLKERVNAKQRNLSKSPSAITNKKESRKPIGSKKPLFKSVKLQPIPKLQQMHPDVQIYIFPKRMALSSLEEQIQFIYEQFWNISKDGMEVGFLSVLYEVVCPYTGPASKPKNDQNLLNILESVNHFQHKEAGVKFFYQILAGKYTNEQLSYFMVLRVLIEEIIGQKIITARPKAITPGNTFSVSTVSTTSGPRQKLKWNPFQKQLSESICLSFLKITLPTAKNIDEVFDRMTQFMYYCQEKKGNFIMYYDLMEFMLREFDKQCADESIANLDLSYSNNDSTLKDILAEEGPRSFEKPLKTKFQMQLVKEPFKEKQSEVQEGQQFDNGQILLQSAIEKAKNMCRRVSITADRQNQIVHRISLCVQSIRTMDKIKWVQAMGLEGTEQQLNFIEQLQMQYRNSYGNGTKLTMANNLVKRIFGGPGVIKIFSSSIIF